MTSIPMENELVERELQWRASLFEVTSYYEAIVTAQSAEITRLQTAFADVVTERDRIQEILEHHERVLGKFRGTVLWRAVRAVGNRAR